MRRFLLSLPFLCLSMPALAACGGSFSDFLKGLESEAVSQHGIAPQTAASFLKGIRQDRAVLRADRKQGVFQLPFVDFARRLISADRINRGRANGEKHDAIFDRIEAEYGVSRGVLLAFWALESISGPIRPADVAGGIGSALTTTVFGLSIAIPASGFLMLAWR